MYFSRCEHILVQPKSTGEVLAALFHSQLAFKALSGHIVFLSLGSCSIYIHIYVAVRHCNVTAFKCSWTIITFNQKTGPIHANGLSVTQVWSECLLRVLAPQTRVQGPPHSAEAEAELVGPQRELQWLLAALWGDADAQHGPLKPGPGSVSQWLCVPAGCGEQALPCSTATPTEPGATGFSCRIHLLLTAWLGHSAS